MKIKQLLGGTALLLMVIIFSACSNGNSAKADKTVTLEFMHSMVQQERLQVINELVSDFEKENPTIKIKQLPVEEDAYNTKVVTLARSNKLPGVIEVGQDFAKVMAKDELIDEDAVNEVMKNLGEESYYIGAKRLVRTEDGKGYLAVPVSGWVQGIWYNKKALADAGYEKPENWEELLKIAQHFNDPDNKKYGIALPTADSRMTEQAFSQFALSDNANVLDKKGNVTIDTPEMAKALAYYQTLSQNTMPGSNDVTEIKDAFLNGSVPMALYSTYLLPAVYEEGKADEIGFAIPTNQQEAVYGAVTGLTIPANDDEQQTEAAEKFITFLSKPENMEKWVLMSPGGAQPVNKQVVDSSTYQENEVVHAFGDLSQEIADAFDSVQIFGLVDEKNFVKMGDITSSGVLSKAVNEATVGNKDPKKLLKDAQQAVE